MSDKKPSEKMLNSSIDGKEIVDSLGRKIRLRKPDILDKFDLMSALGEEKNAFCMMYAMCIIHVVSVDGAVMQSPKSFAEIRASLKLLKEEGIQAVNSYMSEFENSNEKEETEKAKK